MSDDWSFNLNSSVKTSKTKDLPAGCGVKETPQGFRIFKLDPGNPHEADHALSVHMMKHIAIKEAWKALKSPLRKDLKDLWELNDIDRTA